jgi:hypothetical protein
MFFVIQIFLMLFYSETEQSQFFFGGLEKNSIFAAVNKK